MAGSTLGTIFKITTWGESHGDSIGVVVDGIPAGLPISPDDIQFYLDRRKPGKNRYSTPRVEQDQVQILSGTFEGKTTGTPISMQIKNTSQISKDYTEIASYYRPGHADYTFDQKFGFRDYRGGGRSSGRETIGRVAGGAIACKFLKSLGIDFCTYVRSIGPVEIDYERFDRDMILKTNTSMPDETAAKEAEIYLEKCIAAQDSSGGVVECRVNGLPSGLGEPVFMKLDALLAQAMLSIGAAKAFEIGDGILVSRSVGSKNNDAFQCIDGNVSKKTNHAGGVLGGISDGSELITRTYFKPTPSIYSQQETVNKKGENIKINVLGRHDPIIVPRAVVVVETMTASVLFDLLLQNMTSRWDSIKKFYMDQDLEK